MPTTMATKSRLTATGASVSIPAWIIHPARERLGNTGVTPVTRGVAGPAYPLTASGAFGWSELALPLLLSCHAETLPDNGKPVVRRGRKATDQAQPDCRATEGRALK